MVRYSNNTFKKILSLRIYVSLHVDEIRLNYGILHSDVYDMTKQANTFSAVINLYSKYYIFAKFFNTAKIVDIYYDDLLGSQLLRCKTTNAPTNN